MKESWSDGVMESNRPTTTTWKIQIFQVKNESLEHKNAFS